jgi:cell division protein FtsI (penicillin-binding protein 3)
MHSPRYAMYVMVDEPKPNARSHGFATAGWVAAPAAGMVVRSVAPILGMMPETDRAAEIQASIAIPLQPARPAAPRAPAAAPPRQAPGTPLAVPAVPAAAPIQPTAPPRAATVPAPQREASLVAR